MTNNRRERRFTKKMQIKLLAVFAFVLLALVVLLVRITYITAKSGNQYAKQVLSQQSYDSKTIPYRRGEIQDTNGIILAKSDKVYNVVLDCYAINSNQNYIEPTIKAVCTALGLDEADVRDRIENEKTKDSQYQVVKEKATEEEKQAYEDYVSLDADRELSDTQRKELANVQGVWFEEEYQRNYPYSTLASNVIGFSNDIDQGVVGIESYYDDLLNGTNGRTFGYLNEDSEFQKTTIEPEHGDTIVTTLDMSIQQIVEKCIQKFDDTYGDEKSNGKGAKNVGVVVMNPNNGSILGMGTNSEFDLNDPQDLTGIYTGAEIKAMDNDTYVEALNSMWSNFCVSYAYEPGSVIKPITVASALECGATVDSDHYYCDGSQFITDTTIRCDNIYGHGDETLEYAIVNSCNDALMQIGAKMGISNFVKYQSLFNFGSRTGIDLPNESSGSVYTADTMHEVELATCSFGQGLTCNMIQEISAFSAVVNGGYYYQPHVVKQIKNANGSVIKTVDSLVLRQPISSLSSSLVRGYLKTAVQKGTGRKSQVPGYLTGGKTGTAEKIDPETGQRADGKYLVSFIGAAPIDDPKVVIYVIIDEPNVANQADSSYPQTLFREIATEVFPYMGLYPTEEVAPELLAYLGITEADVVKSGSVKETFQAFDSYGNLYNDAYVNEDGTVVSGSGTPIDGAYVNEEGNPVDAYGNVTVLKEKEEVLDPKVDNPDMATPLENTDSDASGTTWDGVTSDDLKAAEE
ncbi:MAG: penicillin-binding transpeptidase domain-containing protein [Lachnospiraceae bacterium]|nr:penicillin-binding transpeptidase domain-containing protein [Lachnospiraceae bacterium]